MGQNLQGAPSPSRDCPVAFCKCAWLICAGIWQFRGKSWLLVPGAGPEQGEEDHSLIKRDFMEQLQPGASVLGDGTASVLDS